MNSYIQLSPDKRIISYYAIRRPSTIILLFMIFFYWVFSSVSIAQSMGSYATYSTIWIDSSLADPDEGQGTLFIVGAAVTQDYGNYFNHTYRASTNISGPGGQTAYANSNWYSSYARAEVAIIWDGISLGDFFLSSTHTLRCPYNPILYNSYTSGGGSFNSTSATDLYYGSDSPTPILISGNTQYCGYSICSMSTNCYCYNYLRSTQTYACSCGTPCAPGLKVSYKLVFYVFIVPIATNGFVCVRTGKTPLSWNPCVGVPPWDPGCNSITN